LDEYQLEIRSLRSTLDRLRAAQSDLALIDEYEAEVRNLSALYSAACDTLAAGERDRRLRDALADLGFGEWTLENVYGFVYEAAMEIDVESSRDLASQINETDYAASLLAAFEMG
jgi:hypothetical protein